MLLLEIHHSFIRGSPPFAAPPPCFYDIIVDVGIVVCMRPSTIITECMYCCMKSKCATMCGEFSVVFPQKQCEFSTTNQPTLTFFFSSQGINRNKYYYVLRIIIPGLGSICIWEDPGGESSIFYRPIYLYLPVVCLYYSS